MKLYEIAAALRAALESMDEYIDEETGEVSPDFMAKLEGLEDDVRAKIEGIGVVCRELKGDTATVKDEIARLRARKLSMEGRIAWLTGYVSDTMRALDIGKHTSPNGLFTVYMQKNPDRVEVDYPDNLPAKYQRIMPVEPMLKDLKSDMAGGRVSDSVLSKAGVRTIEGTTKVRYK